jgi:hypothetical protein
MMQSPASAGLFVLNLRQLAERLKRFAEVSQKGSSIFTIIFQACSNALPSA